MPGRTSAVGYVSPVAYLRRASIYKGFLRGRRGWMVVGAVLWTPTMVRKVLGRKPELVATEKLRAGQGVQIEALRITRADARRAR